MMIEYYTKAFVLNRESKGEMDAWLTLYTKDLGKIKAKAKSVRKITSKLSGHLTPGKLVELRIIEINGGGYQVVDALSLPGEVTPELLRFFDFIDEFVPAALPDLYLWRELELVFGQKLPLKSAYRRFISVIGYNPEKAACDHCGSRRIAYFAPRDIMFLCSRCLVISGLKENEVIAI
jgi:hypothetical protein